MRHHWATTGAGVLLLAQLACSSSTGPEAPGFYEYTITTNGQSHTVTGTDAAFWTYYPIYGQTTNLGVYFFVGAITALQIEPGNALPPTGTYQVAGGGGGTIISVSIVGDALGALDVDSSSTMTLSTVDDNRIAGTFTIVLDQTTPYNTGAVLKGRFNAARTNSFRSN
jgi:hypothetical protein